MVMVARNGCRSPPLDLEGALDAGEPQQWTGGLAPEAMSEKRQWSMESSAQGRGSLLVRTPDRRRGICRADCSFMSGWC